MKIVTWRVQFAVGQTVGEMGSTAIVSWRCCLNKRGQQIKRELPESVAEVWGQMAVCGEKEFARVRGWVGREE